MEVDWAGNTLPVYDFVTDETSKAYLFVAVLPCSCYTYAEACADMTQENWLLCHAHAYNYFGGVTRLLIPDNLKTGVTANTRYETVLNRSYREMAEFYDTAVVPYRVEAPKDKSHADGSVKFASTWILAALRNEKFFSYEEVSKVVKEKLEELNSCPFTGKNRIGCRRSGYLEEEKSFMKPLPVSSYEPATWIPGVKVGYDYLVSDGINKYSVPFDLIGEKVVKGFLSGGKEVEQGFKACASLTKMTERYGAERLESVCAKVLTHTAVPSIRIISTVLKNGQDKPKKTETHPEQDYSNSYGITRGVEYFRKGGASQ